jgi:4-hydroxy-4-methyl-2-oxoglutarate aldolase
MVKIRTLPEESWIELRKMSSSTAWGTLGQVLRDEYMRDHYRMMNMRPIDRGYTICGPAVTVRYLPLDPLNPTSEGSELMGNHATMIVKMMNTLKTGDILVLAALGRSDAGVAGEGMCNGFKAHGASALVVDGGERDVPIIRSDVKLPVFMSGNPTPTVARYHMHNGKPGGVLPKEINIPVICDGVRVRPGDVIIGDECGLMVIPIENAEMVAKIGGALEDIEELQRRLIQKGEYVHMQPMTEEILKKYNMLDKWRIAKEAQV